MKCCHKWFYAKKWDACKALGESLTQYEASKKENVVIYKIDIEEQKELTKVYSVYAIPMLIYLKDDEIINIDLGIQTPKQIKRNILSYNILYFV